MGPEDLLVTRIYGQAVLRQIAEACEADPTRETCGFVVRKGGALEVVQIQNVADRYRERDPAAFLPTSRGRLPRACGRQPRLMSATRDGTARVSASRRTGTKCGTRGYAEALACGS